MLLGQLMRGYREAVCVAGTHGKTSTTAMLARALVECGLDPSVHLGGSFDFIGGSTRVGGHGVFVAEACEFHASFLEMQPTVAVVLNVEEDHLDYYRDIDHIAQTFARFVSLVPPHGVCAVNGDDPRAPGAAGGPALPQNHLRRGRAQRLAGRRRRMTRQGRASFDAAFRGEVRAHVALRVPGAFNVLNALAALAAADAVGADAACAGRKPGPV